MHIILHITQKQQWEQAEKIGIYRGDTLDTEGFIHCSTPKQVIPVANRFFLHQQGLVILFIDSDRVEAEILYEEAEKQENFPHIYGALNISAVLNVLDFPVGDNGYFQLSPEIKTYFQSMKIIDI
ncbi:DUF952 domain-containing protein [Calothrix rhizosoleniae]|uniref:DUF952 domain-containing protein n=1 Tax=Calothrix rhizosoleniae TaxID=888997 RepID=UPI000B49D166|nr:DUF952 domain-containing protein [Calothrix rhizosoleniae]